MDTEFEFTARPHIGRMLKLFKSPTARLRAKLARASGAYLGYGGFIETVLADDDPRVRANAIESLWQTHADRIRELLLRASSDSHARVRANALLGLYQCDPPSAVQALIGQASDANALRRASAAWAMGETGDVQFREVLLRLAEDSDSAVVNRAKIALAALEGQPEPSGVISGGFYFTGNSTPKLCGSRSGPFTSTDQWSTFLS